MRVLRRRPPVALLVLAAVVVALLATPIVFVVADLAQQPDGGAWRSFWRSRTWTLTLNTVGLVGATTAACLLLGVPTAYLVTRTNLAWRRGWLMLVALPLAIPSYVAGFAWVSLTPLRGFWGSLIVLTLVSTPYVTLPVAAALRRAETDTEAVARTLGAGPWRAFVTTTLPQIAPAAGAGALLVALYCLAEFGVVSVMRYPAFTWAIHTAFSGSFNRSLALTLSLLLVALALGVVAAERAVRRRAVGQLTPPATTARTPIRLRAPGQLAAGAGLTAVTVAAIGVPVVTMLERAARSIAQREAELERLLAAALATVGLGLAGAALATLLALPIGILAARHRTRTVGALETGTYLAHGLPGIVLGLSMVYLTLALLPGIYQTMLALVLAYGILFVPKAAGSVRTAIAQVPLALEDASRTLGRSRAGTSIAVTGRLAWPGITAGALLVALTVMKELPATLMLRPIGTDTLATRLWQLTDIAAYGAAAPYAITLVAVASVPALLLSRGTLTSEEAR
ncbi:ABC transporter permease [Pseudactinotalea sp.]|uniref:ABC transporter permease n=1 Tax=Pseudactinotalea sp. TaxID=1926260 RepID=UPI003B3BCC14